MEIIELNFSKAKKFIPVGGNRLNGKTHEEQVIGNIREIIESVKPQEAEALRIYLPPNNFALVQYIRARYAASHAKPESIVPLHSTTNAIHNIL